jgi:hypothetical protein
MLELGSEAFASVPFATSNEYGSGREPTQGRTPHPTRDEQQRIVGGVRAVLFDFDGTLTATPGDRAARKFKIAELKERAPLLEPWLRRLRDASLTLGILSKSSEETILSALRQAGLREVFNGPSSQRQLAWRGRPASSGTCARKAGGSPTWGPTG